MNITLVALGLLVVSWIALVLAFRLDQKDDEAGFKEFERNLLRKYLERGNR